VDLRARRRHGLPGDGRLRGARGPGGDRGGPRRRRRRPGRGRPALLLPLAWLSAAAGDLVSFLLGRRLGRRFLLERGPRLGVSHARLAQIEAFFDRHGPKAILIGRFIGIIRAVAPFLAGASGMRVRAFVPWSLLGTAAWATTFTLVGYVFHASFSAAPSS
jgi:membrane protein DedA with SNARE-associated domain